MISAGDFRNGITIEYENSIYQIIEFQHVKPGKGAAFVRTKLKNIISGGVVEKTFRPTEKCPQARIDRKEMQYLYEDGDLYNFMDMESYEQIALNQEVIGDALKFVKENEDWLIDYALFMAVKAANDGKSFIEWDEDIKLRKPAAVEKCMKEYKDTIDLYCFIQYEFFKQWEALRKYANDNGIEIVGDIPIYVAYDSADVWTNPELFVLDKDLKPIKVAGCPPDAFSEDGQLWGNPLYKWDYHKKTGYKWWKDRMAACNKLYDMVRIDHFRGFDEYYSIPYGEKTAVNGQWEKGPGIDLFKAVEKAIGKQPVIAEDLGFMTDTVRQLVEDTEFPGMKVLEFAFDSRDSGSANDYLPHNYHENCVAYTGTSSVKIDILSGSRLVKTAVNFISSFCLTAHSTPLAILP